MNQTKTGSRTTLWLFTVFYQLSFAFYSYQTVYLRGCGFTSAQLGMVNAAVYACAMPATLLFGMLSDRLGSVKRVLLPVLVIGTLCYAAVPFVPAEGAYFVAEMIVLLAVCGMLRNAGYSLSENILVRGCAENGFNHGLIRGTGSLSYALAALSCIFLVPLAGTKATFYALAVCLIPVLLCLNRVPDPGAAESRRRFSAAELGSLLRLRPLAVYLIFLFIYYMAARGEDDFLVVFMGRVGIDTSLYGLLNCFRAALEFPMLFLMIRLRARFPLKWISAAAALLKLLDCLLMPRLGVTLGGLIAVQLLSGMANGILIGTTTNYVSSVAPQNLQATAAALLSIVSTLSGLAGSMLGGTLFDRMELIPLYTLFACVFAAGFVFFLAAELCGKRSSAG